MTASSNDQPNDALTVTVTSGGSEIPDWVRLIELTVHNGVNGVPWALIVMADGDMADGRPAVADSGLFAPGAEVGISLGHGSGQSLVFEGVVVRLGLRMGRDNGSRLEIECRGKVSVRAPATDGESALKVTWGVDLMTFEGDIDARTQLDAVRASSRDPKTQATLEQAGKSQADAELLKAELTRVRGRMTFQGSALVAPASTLEVAGLGARFDGKVFVSSARHAVAEGNWITEVEFGLAPAIRGHKD